MHGFVRGLSRSVGINYPDQPHMEPQPLHHPPTGPGAAFKPVLGCETFLGLQWWLLGVPGAVLPLDWLYFCRCDCWLWLPQLFLLRYGVTILLFGGGGVGVSLLCHHSACCCSLAGDATLLSKQTLGCCYESEISVCINLGLSSLAENVSGLC